MAPLFHGRLAELQAEQTSVDEALASIERAIESAREGDIRYLDALLHRIRGDILLEAHPEDSAPAEQAYLAAIAVAQQQGARSFGLLAALKLAKLYQSTARPVEAHDILAPALEGFSPTPEMAEIAEAQALLAALAATDEVKETAASRQRRLQLQASYGQALMWSRGFASEEATAAFARAHELAKRVDHAAERFDAYYGRFIAALTRGELRAAREIADSFLHDAEKEGGVTEAGVARRCLGLASFVQGDFNSARAHFEQVLATWNPERDAATKFRFGLETGACVTVYLALANSRLGELELAGKQAAAAVVGAFKSNHPATLANVCWFKALFEALRGDAEGVRRATNSFSKSAARMAWGSFRSWASCAPVGRARGWAIARPG